MAGLLTRDDVLANHGRFDGNAPGLQELGRQFDLRRRAQWQQQADASAPLNHSDPAGEIKRQGANVDDSVRASMSPEWAGFSGRLGAQEEEADETGRRYAQVMPGGGGAAMPAVGGRGTGGGGGGLQALQALAGRGGGGEAGQDPRVQQLLTQRLIEGLSAPQHRVGQVNQLGGPVDVLTDATPTQGDAINSAGVDAAAKAGIADTLDRQYGGPAAIRHAQTAGQVSNIGFDTGMEQFMDPRSDYKRSEELGAKMAPITAQGGYDVDVAEKKRQGDMAGATGRLEGDRTQGDSAALKALTDLAKQYLVSNQPVPKDLQAGIGEIQARLRGGGQ